MKRINQKEWARLQALNAKLSEAFSDRGRQSHDVWRGDVRAIQWATWWIREVLDEQPHEVDRAIEACDA